jgi:hypothetical protein
LARCADPADLGGEVETRSGRASRTDARRRPARQVDSGDADDDVGAAGAEPLDEVRAEEAAAAGDEDPHGGQA